MSARSPEVARRRRVAFRLGMVALAASACGAVTACIFEGEGSYRGGGRSGQGATQTVGSGSATSPTSTSDAGADGGIPDAAAD